MSLASISRQYCATCAEETLHRMCACVHCGKAKTVKADGKFELTEAAFPVGGGKTGKFIHGGSPSSKSRRKASAESGMPAHVAAEGGPR